MEEDTITASDIIEADRLEKREQLIIFEENLTADGLDAILEESKTWPVTVSNKHNYDFIYDQHQRFKRLSIAIRKKADELIKESKETLVTRKIKIDKDLNFVLEIINPLIKRLGDSRQMYDDVKEAYKMNTAIDAAKIQAAEQSRQEQIRATQRRIQEEKDEDASLRMDYLRDEDNAWTEYQNKIAVERQLNEDQRIEAERLKLARERYEFECDKSRLSREHAEIDAYRWPRYTAEPEAHEMNSWFDIERERLGFRKSRLDFDEAWEEFQNMPIDESGVSRADIEEGAKHGAKIISETNSDGSGALLNADMFATDADQIDTGKDFIIISDISEMMEDDISYIERFLNEGLSDPRLQIELKNFISRVKMNFKNFKAAVNQTDNA